MKLSKELGGTRRMLLIIDPQIDFINGSLQVPGAAEAMESLSRYIFNAEGKYCAKVITADWHPFTHKSFRENGGVWPRHCVHDTIGATISPSVFMAAYSTVGDCEVLHKGLENDHEEYSIFENDEAARQIKDIVKVKNVEEIDICGLAGDVCVLASLKQGLQLLPWIKFNVLEEYSPSIDGGKELRRFIEQM